jgi:hypothetical protein
MKDSSVPLVEWKVAMTSEDAGEMMVEASGLFQG